MFTNLQVGIHEILELDLLIFYYFSGWFAQNSFYYDSFEVMLQYFSTTLIYLMCVT
jgi:hypothetical protein